MSGDRPVLGHANLRLVRAGDDRDGNVLGDIATENLSGAGGQGLDVARHHEEKPGMSPALADETNGLRRKLGQLTQNALDRITGGRSERAEHAAMDRIA